MCSNGCSRTPCERLVPITSPVPTSCTATKSSRRWHSTDSGTKWNSLTKSVRIAVATGTRHSIGSISARWAIAPIKQPISHSPKGFLTKSRCANERRLTPSKRCYGLLGLYEHDTYVLDLLRTFEHLAAKYTLEPMDASAWNLTDIRPANHPLLRIVQAARFFIQDEFVMNRTLECRDPKEVQRLFGVEAPEYWNTHYTPGAECEWHPKRIGKFKSDIIGINLVAVLQFAYGSYMDDERLRENALKLLEAIEPESNRFIRSWCDAGVPAPANAFESQALLQLSKIYCAYDRCAECPVGRRILAKVRRMAPPEE